MKSAEQLRTTARPTLKREHVGHSLRPQPITVTVSNKMVVSLSPCCHGKADKNEELNKKLKRDPMLGEGPRGRWIAWFAEKIYTLLTRDPDGR